MTPPRNSANTGVVDSCRYGFDGLITLQTRVLLTDPGRTANKGVAILGATQMLLESISHRCYLREVEFECELT